MKNKVISKYWWYQKNNNDVSEITNFPEIGWDGCCPDIGEVEERHG